MLTTLVQNDNKCNVIATLLFVESTDVIRWDNSVDLICTPGKTNIKIIFLLETIDIPFCWLI